MKERKPTAARLSASRTWEDKKTREEIDQLEGAHWRMCEAGLVATLTRSRSAVFACR